MDTRWSRSTSNFYALIGQNLTGEFMPKIYAASWNLFTFDSWSWQSFVSTCDVFFMSFSTGCTKWNTAAIKSLLLFMAGLFIGFLVEKCSILKLVYFDSWSWQSFLSTCDVFLLSFPTGCTKWNTAAINSLLLFMDALFTEFLVEKCCACQSHRSDFGWHRFHFSPCWMRVEKSLKRLSGAASRMVSLSNYCVCFLYI